MGNSDKSWEKWGEVDPYFGVLSDEKYRGSKVERHLEDFFGSGRSYIETRLFKLEKYFGEVSRANALDFGCGVGRLTNPLGDAFSQAIGLDVAEGMIREAQAVANQRSVHNVMFKRYSGLEDIAIEQFDFVSTYIVLQHIAIGDGMQIIKRLATAVNTNGLLNIHFSVSRNQAFLQRIRYRLQTSVPGVQPLANLIAGRPVSDPLMEMNEYSLYDVISLIESCGYEDFLVNTECHGGVSTVHVASKRVKAI